MIRGLFLFRSPLLEKTRIVLKKGLLRCFNSPRKARIKFPENRKTGKKFKGVVFCKRRKRKFNKNRKTWKLDKLELSFRM